MSNVTVRGRLGHSDLEIIQVLTPGEVRWEASRMLPWTSRGQTLACVGDWLREFLGRQSRGTKGSRKTVLVSFYVL